MVVCSPYFVPDESLLHALTTEARSGVEVRLYVGETSDHWLTHRAQQSYYDELVRAGVRIFMYHAPTVLHSNDNGGGRPRDGVSNGTAVSSPSSPSSSSASFEPDPHPTRNHPSSVHPTALQPATVRTVVVAGFPGPATTLHVWP